MAEMIGFIGLGNMGQPIAGNLLRAGHRLRVYNRTAAKAAPLVAQGATQVQRPAEVAEGGGIVFTMLADDRAVEEIFAQDTALLERLGQGGLHVSLSTISPATSRRLAEQHSKFGVDYVGAPVFGRPEAAAAAKLWICFSDAAAAKKRAGPLLQALGQGTFDFGEDPGAANVVKLCGNFLLAAAIEAMAEAFTLAEKNGLTRSHIADMLTATLFACPVYQRYGKLVAEHRYEPAGFQLGLGLKDIRLALETAGVNQVPMPVGSVLYDRWLSAVAKGRGHLDWSAAALGVSEDAGLSVSQAAKAS